MITLTFESTTIEGCLRELISWTSMNRTVIIGPSNVHYSYNEQRFRAHKITIKYQEEYSG